MRGRAQLQQHLWTWCLGRTGRTFWPSAPPCCPNCPPTLRAMLKIRGCESRPTYTERTLQARSPTQNLPEIQQQCSFSIQHVFLAASSFFLASAPPRPRAPAPQALRVAVTVLISRSRHAAGRQLVRRACVQEVIAGVGEGIRGHGQTGRGPLAGRGDTLCRENRRKASNPPSRSALVCVAVTMETCLPLPGNRWFEDYELRNR